MADAPVAAAVAVAEGAVTGDGPGALDLVLASGRSLFSFVRSVPSVVGRGWTWAKENPRTTAGVTLATAAVAGYAVYRKVSPMLAQLRTELQAMETMMNQLNPQATPAHKHAILIHRLEHNLSVGDLTLRQFAGSVRSDLVARFDVDEIRARLRKSKETAAAGGDQAIATEEQRLLWIEFKVAGVARSVASAYVVALLHALVKLQVSVVSRYVLIDQQAQAARQEAEAAAAAGQPDSNPPAPGAPGGGPPTFLPTAVCEEVNRVYFSLSTHARGPGAHQLADAVAAGVRAELAGQELTSDVSPQHLQQLVQRIREHVDEQALGLECKSDDEAPNGGRRQQQAIASSSGASAASTIFSLPAGAFARYLLPSSEALSLLVSSGTAFPDPTVQNMASFRLAEMVAETNALLGTEAFQHVLRASTRAAMQEVATLLVNTAFPQLQQQLPTPPKQVPFANALVSMIKSFSTLMPDVSSTSTPPTAAAAAAASSVSSPLFHALGDLPAVKEFCAVIYLPSDAIAAPLAEGQPSTLQQITSNKTFAGAAAAASTGPSPMTIEVLPSGQQPASLQSHPRGPMHAQLQHAVQDVKGLPVFDRL